MAKQANTFSQSLTVGGAAIGARTATFNTDSFVNDNNEALYITAIATAVSGTTPSMTAKLQWSPDNGTTWLDLDATNAITAALTAAGNATFVAGPGVVVAANASANKFLPRLLRVAVTITGTTPSFTMALWANGAL
jgi:hypothetical protein